jgi:hypothetical protein
MSRWLEPPISSFLPKLFQQLVGIQITERRLRRAEIVHHVWIRAFELHWHCVWKNWSSALRKENSVDVFRVDMKGQLQVDSKMRRAQKIIHIHELVNRRHTHGGAGQGSLELGIKFRVTTFPRQASLGEFKIGGAAASEPLLHLSCHFTCFL